MSTLLETYGETRIIEQLSKLLLVERVETLKQCISQRLQHIWVACEHPYDIHNAFAVIRTAEAMGVFNIHIISNDKIKTSGKATTQGAKRWVNCDHNRDFSEFKKHIPSNMKIAAADLNATHSLDTLPLDEPICLLFGNEKEGISAEARTASDYRFKLPLYGMSQSYNLSIAAALSLQQITTRYRQQLSPQQSDLTTDEKKTLLAQYLIQSIGVEKAKVILNNLGLSLSSG